MIIGSGALIVAEECRRAAAACKSSNRFTTAVSWICLVLGIVTSYFSEGMKRENVAQVSVPELDGLNHTLPGIEFKEPFEIPEKYAHFATAMGLILLFISALTNLRNPVVAMPLKAFCKKRYDQD